MGWNLETREADFWHYWWLHEGSLQSLCNHENAAHIPFNWFWTNGVWNLENYKGLSSAYSGRYPIPFSFHEIPKIFCLTSSHDPEDSK
ncbi:UNVERIFIED_CONTAM: hypothetical protein Slati_1455900 [Sesamum latifolium]|uniref:Uncharacterized protein n=1 Tax=Sesamum latifolium TaxID=2727402 RepID=A0AAW2XA12_9LAMI